MNDILIGFEVGSGRPVTMKEHHGVVSGQTQMSGKTTTIKALISRSGRKAVIFLTKRGEIEFHGLNQVQPYFKEQTGWRYIKSLLEAQEQRKMVFNEPWIIKACEGVKTLRGVLENTERLMKAARRDFDKDQYLVLIEYLKVVVPAVESRPWARSLPLEKGINVMDLVELPVQMQALVIQSTLNYIMDKMRGVIAVIPEAWKFVPKSGNPVKLAADSYIRQGASIGNYLWIDSQDLAGVDTAILKQCNNWLMGFQRELNEAKRVAETAGHRITVSMIQSLKRGHFVASLGVENPQLVYVWPEGVPMQMVIDVAMGLLSPEVVKDYLDKLRQQREETDDMVWKERYEESQRKLDEAQAELTRLKEQPTASNDELGRMQQRIDALSEAVGSQMVTREQAEARARELQSQLESFTRDAAAMDGQLQRLDAENRELRGRLEGLKGLESFVEYVKGAAGAGGPAPSPAPQVVVAQAPVDLEDRVVARVKDLIRGEGVRLVDVSVDEAAREALLGADYGQIRSAVSALSEKAKSLALMVRERRKAKATDLYFLVSGKTTGRPAGDFYVMLRQLQDANLVAKRDDQVEWILEQYLAGRLTWLSPEQVKRVADNLAAGLLPPEAKS